MASQELNNAISVQLTFQKMYVLKKSLLANFNVEKLIAHFLSEINEHI